MVFGYFGFLGYWLSGFIGGIVGDKLKLIEDIKFLKSLLFLCDSIVSIIILMVIIYFIVVVFVGEVYIVKEISNGVNGFVYVF